MLANIGILPAVSGDFIRTFAELGIIFIMFSLGFEESTDNFLASVKRSWGIALFGALGPFAVSFLIADMIWHDLNISLMIGFGILVESLAEPHGCNGHCDQRETNQKVEVPAELA